MSGTVVGMPKKRLLEDSFDITPIGLQFCFDRELFLRDEFNVDKFVMRQKKVVSLELLRDDLMQYFNILKNSLVELINQDYADFVNLSTNLVGLDKVIGTIEVPIEKEKLNVEKVRDNVDNTLEEINKRKYNLKLLREKRELIQCIENVQRYVNLLERRLKIDSGVANKENIDIDSKEDDDLFVKDTGQKLEIIGYEFTHLEYFTAKCMHHTIIDSFKERIQKITLELQDQLEQYFISNLRNKNKKSVQQALRTYLTINKICVAEQLYRDHFVQPELGRLNLSKKHFEQDMGFFYKEILEIVDRLLNSLQGILTDDVNRSDVNDFDFLVNSIFSEIVYFIIKSMPQVFSPGNPDLFYQRYTCTIKFIDEIEDRCISIDQLKSLRNSRAYQDFHNKWSVSIYFQIRYQEIISLIDRESCKEEISVTKSDSYSFPIIGIIHDAISRCWQEGIYLDILKHRFWKLNLQLINFLENYMSNMEWNKFVYNNDSSKHIDDTAQNSKLINLKTVFLIDMFKILDIQSIDSSLSPIQKNYGGLVWIYHKYLNPILNDCLCDKDKLCLQQMLMDSTDRMKTILSNIVASIQSMLMEQCIQSIKVVFDIPRKYRRTNRPWPTTASNYVDDIFKPISLFISNHEDLDKDGKLRVEILKKIIIDITASYQEQIKDLLNSIKKMEDSLKMFKRTRSTNIEQLTSDRNVATVSDDDKIRQQVKIDVAEFQAKSCQLLMCSQDSVPELRILGELVNEMCNVDN